ncbi:phosphate acetyltransferase [uncultured Finegoldia sp.]|uniref:phosphate acetyltransferase n=1 Tax=uncultured Finegoldia sp. TaxID=328009 RepID=UPI00260D2F6F|nr:phosphate acetyltransferase [uncultured Finegoldia sp.]
MDIFESLKSKISGKNLKIVFPEGEEPRILRAVARLNEEKIITPVVLGDESKIKELAEKEGLNINEVKIVNPLNAGDFDEKVQQFVERRKGKNTEDQAKTMLKDVNYYATMMLYNGEVDGLVSGAVHSTGDTVKPALQIIKTKPGTKLVSGAMIMIGPNGERYLFSDIAINIELTEEQLAEVGVVSAETAKLYDIDPKVSFLSFSTKGSANHPLAQKVANATKIAQEMAPELPIDGEMQFDASIVESVGKQKAPDSKVAGHANVFIFPDLQAGNIGYKIAQRLGKFEAIGPILQGMAKPVNDLSRGCNEEDVYKLAIITAAQAL